MSEPEIEGLPEDSKSEIFNNLNELPVHRPVVDRPWEVETIEAFLNQNKPVVSKQDSIKNTFPPSILVIHGPRGVGKTTLIREISERYLQKDNFRMILWVNREKFIDLVGFGELPAEIDPAISSDLIQAPTNTPLPFQTLRPDEIQQIQEDFSLIGAFLRELAKRGSVRNEERKKYHHYLHRLLNYQPYLLIIDDFDEGYADKTPQLCRELERFRAPNKVILTSRSNTFGFSESVPECPVGLLGEDETKALARAECEEIPPYLLVNEDLEDTTNWIWSVSGGLPDFITQFLLREVRQNYRHLGPRGDWSQLFDQYALRYLSSEIDQMEDVENFNTKVFDQLNHTEKYILTALASQEPPQALELNALFQMLGVVEQEHQQYIECYQSLVGLFEKRFLGRRIMMRQTGKQHWYWYLLPFMTGLIRSTLQEYQVGYFYRERTQRWITCFKYHLSHGHASQLRQHQKQALADLAWCIDHDEWQLSITLGELIVHTFDELGEVDNSEYAEACDRIVKAAKASGNSITEIKYKLKRIVHISDFGQRYREIITLVERLEELGSSVADIESVNGEVAHLYAKCLIILGQQRDAEKWLNKAIRDYESQDNQLPLNWARLDLSELYLRTGDQAAAIVEAQKTETELSSLNQEDVSAQLVKASTIRAFVLYRQGNLQDSLSSLEEALDNARKRKGGGDLEREILKAKEFVELLIGKFDPVKDVDSFLNHSFLPVEMGTQCPLCYEKIRREEIFSDFIWLCQTCQNYFHIFPCIEEHNITKCPNCDTAFPQRLSEDSENGRS